jgi:hypothetical protein
MQTILAGVFLAFILSSATNVVAMLLQSPPGRVRRRRKGLQKRVLPGRVRQGVSRTARLPLMR